MALERRDLRPQDPAYVVQWMLRPYRYLSLYRLDDMDWLVQNSAYIHSKLVNDGLSSINQYRTLTSTFGTVPISSWPSLSWSEAKSM